MLGNDRRSLSTRTDPLVRGIVLIFIATCTAAVGFGSLLQDIADRSTTPFHIVGWITLIIIFPVMIFCFPYLRYWRLRAAMRNNVDSIPKSSKVVFFSALSRTEEVLEENTSVETRTGHGWLVCRPERIDIVLVAEVGDVCFSIARGELVHAAPTDDLESLLALPTFKVSTVGHQTFELIPVFIDHRDIFGYQKWILVRLARNLMATYGARPSN